MYLHILRKRLKGGKKLCSLSHTLMWKWQLSAEVVGWGCPSIENKLKILKMRLPQFDAAFSSALEYH